VGLVITQLTVGEDHTPHHLRQHHLLTEVVLRRNQPRELEVVERLRALGLGQGHELSYFGLGQTEMPSKGTLYMGPLLSTELVIGMRQLEQERTRGELDPGVLIGGSVWSTCPGVSQPLIEEPPNGFDHGRLRVLAARQ
jgi:hypothetical protein